MTKVAGATTSCKQGQCYGHGKDLLQTRPQAEVCILQADRAGQRHVDTPHPVQNAAVFVEPTDLNVNAG